MAICTFIGDNDAPESIRERIREALIILIKNFDVNFFYIGNEGNFNIMAIDEIKKLSKYARYSYIDYDVIVCNIPYRKYSPWEIFMENLCIVSGAKGANKEKIIEKYARWMIDESEYVIAYTKDRSSDTYKLIEYSKHNGKMIYMINKMRGCFFTAPYLYVIIL